MTSTSTINKFSSKSNSFTQDELKAQVGQAALAYVEKLPAGSVIGVGTGSTVNHFIAALQRVRHHIGGAVSSSTASTQRLQELGIKVLDANDVSNAKLAVYIDGADEIDVKGNMIKGGGAALTREKIVASLAQQFICIVDVSKQVSKLGKFPIPVEIIPMAYASIAAQFTKMGGHAVLRCQTNGMPVVTDNQQHILDVFDLSIEDALVFESTVNQWPGVVTVGVFAHQKAHVCLLGTPNGVVTEIFTQHASLSNVSAVGCP